MSSTRHKQSVTKQPHWGQREGVLHCHVQSHSERGTPLREMQDSEMQKRAPRVGERQRYQLSLFKSHGLLSTLKQKCIKLKFKFKT